MHFHEKLNVQFSRQNYIHVNNVNVNVTEKNLNVNSCRQTFQELFRYMASDYFESRGRGISEIKSKSGLSLLKQHPPVLYFGLGLKMKMNGVEWYVVA